MTTVWKSFFLGERDGGGGGAGRKKIKAPIKINDGPPENQKLPAVLLRTHNANLGVLSCSMQRTENRVTVVRGRVTLECLSWGAVSRLFGGRKSVSTAQMTDTKDRGLEVYERNS